MWSTQLGRAGAAEYTGLTPNGVMGGYYEFTAKDAAVPGTLGYVVAADAALYGISATDAALYGASATDAAAFGLSVIDTGDQDNV